MSQITESAPRVFDLDPEALGNMVIRLGLISRQLDHTRVTHTVDPYLNHPEIPSPPEAEFLRDLLTKPVPEIIDRWYGGDDQAARMYSVIWAELGRRRRCRKSN